MRKTTLLSANNPKPWTDLYLPVPYSHATKLRTNKSAVRPETNSRSCLGPQPNGPTYSVVTLFSVTRYCLNLSSLYSLPISHLTQFVNQNKSLWFIQFSTVNNSVYYKLAWLLVKTIFLNRHCCRHSIPNVDHNPYLPPFRLVRNSYYLPMMALKKCTTRHFPWWGYLHFARIAAFHTEL